MILVRIQKKMYIWDFKRKLSNIKVFFGKIVLSNGKNADFVP